MRNQGSSAVGCLFGLGWMLVAVAGCSDEALSPAPVEAAGGGGTSAGSGGAPLVPPGPPEPLPVASWMVASTNAAGDPVLPAIEQQSFSLPPEGDYLGLDWQPVTPGADHELVDAFTDLLYAAAVVSVPPGRRAFARGDTVLGFYVDNAARQPGDFYHSRMLRVPLAGEGEHLVVARALGRRNTPEIELWSTDAEIVLNLDDVTAPELVAGAGEEQPLGVPVLNLTDEALADVSARVIDGPDFEATEVRFASLAPNAVTQLSFVLRPKEVGATALTAQLRVESPSLVWSYDAEVDIATVGSGDRRRRTRRSGVDGSTQYDAVMPPSDASQSSYGLILSLHGAGVQASNQAAAYSPKDWAYLVAPTNRRPFGFDWEEWGRLDAIEALDHALATLPIDPTRVHLTGHSMGGHGSWHVGVHHSGRFGVVAPSAGWISFEKYTGPPHPSGPVGRARAHSQTLDYVENFATSSIYIVHGSSDDNVPVSHAREMAQVLLPITPELVYHEEPGARHWWDLDQNEEGSDCVDWEPMIAVMEARSLDPLPLDFTYRTPSPFINPVHSYLEIRSALSPMEDASVSSSASGSEVVVTTDNVRSLSLDGDALLAGGIDTAIVDGTPHALSGGRVLVGPANGKNPEQHGPLNQVFHRPFCFVWDESAPRAYRDYAAHLLSWWSLVGNGHGCGLPLGALTSSIEAEHNLIFVGVARADLPPSSGTLPIDWSADAITVGGRPFADAAMAFVYPAADRLRAYVYATAGSEYLLFRYVPMSSRAGMPDFFVFQASGVATAGFFEPDGWQLEPAFSTGL